jgi:hypothetical protein
MNMVLEVSKDDLVNTTKGKIAFLSQEIERGYLDHLSRTTVLMPNELPTFHNLSCLQKKKTHLDESKTKLRGLSLRANYTDRATAACR